MGTGDLNNGCWKFYQARDVLTVALYLLQETLSSLSRGGKRCTMVELPFERPFEVGAAGALKVTRGHRDHLT